MKNLKWFLGLVFLVGTANAAIREIPVNSGRSIRAQIDTYAELLQKELDMAKNNKERFRAIRRVTDEIKVVRENNMPQSAADEAYMDLMLTVFESVPTEKNFKKSDCSRYEYEILNQYEPTAEMEPVEPAVKPGWNAISSLCR
ncbi:hypothetical protein B9G69_010685 [Bdellovibrio sp. SKB1291214]|uniref:hypothetical protein n=1 Tax=Bdellovibrio sp. SKB1291214 TaxID=1732569 RepID=UPI0020CD1023|nr:hypothetical protein [Bdellovibrio sp. SKB1291214]UYL07510.1 hypothetical protein B9G69_010685 [Bdellovibrio sp. SKB1291214]